MPPSPASAPNGCAGRGGCAIAATRPTAQPSRRSAGTSRRSCPRPDARSPRLRVAPGRNGRLVHGRPTGCNQGDATAPRTRRSHILRPGQEHHHRQDPRDRDRPAVGHRGRHRPGQRHVTVSSPFQHRPWSTAEATNEACREERASTSHMGPAVTTAVGRPDDWMRDVVARDGARHRPGIPSMGWGVAALLKAYEIFAERAGSAPDCVRGLPNDPRTGASAPSA